MNIIGVNFYLSVVSASAVIDNTKTSYFTQLSIVAY